MTITPHKWPSITPITPLFRRAIDLYNTQLPKIFRIFSRSKKIQLSIKGEGSAKDLYNTQLPKIFPKFLEKLKNLEKKQKKSISTRGGVSAIHLYNTQLSKIWRANDPL